MIDFMYAFTCQIRFDVVEESRRGLHEADRQRRKDSFLEQRWVGLADCAGKNEAAPGDLCFVTQSLYRDRLKSMHQVAWMLQAS